MLVEEAISILVLGANEGRRPCWLPVHDRRLSSRPAQAEMTAQPLRSPSSIACARAKAYSAGSGIPGRI